MSAKAKDSTKAKDRSITVAKLPTWMVEMAKSVGANRDPREDVADVLERLVGDDLEREYDETVAATKASKRGEK